MASGDSEQETIAGAETAELSVQESRSGLPVRPGDLRDALPGLEPDRRVTDWGRSERLEGLVDRTVYGFLYHYWFRVDAEAIENIPRTGGALLLANHGGAIPAAGAMIAKAIAAEHPRPRPLHLATDRALGGIPWLGMLAAKIGAVPAHPANLHRLLFDEQQVVLAFPEGRDGAGKPLSERYRLRAFARPELIAAAVRARVPIVPAAVVGAEEATPVFARVDPLRRLTRLPRVPLSTGLPLPAKIRIRFLEPVLTNELGDDVWEDEGRMQALSDDIRALVQENVLEMVSERRSVWLG
jgi:1-acyl-sn-glycerol-3-phosphate acyltransferase